MSEKGDDSLAEMESDRGEGRQARESGSHVTNHY